jgi:hypothetical protein
MKHYTSKEFEDLINYLEDNRNHKSWSRYIKLSLKLNKLEFSITEDILRTAVFNAKSKTILTHTPGIKEIFNFIHVKPLKKMPLYINTHPELAKWRMRIGK